MARIRGWFLLAAAASCSAPAQADVTARYAFANSDPEAGPPVELSMTVEVSDGGPYRLQLPGVPYYLLARGDELYLIKSAGDEVQVMRAEDVETVTAEHAREQGTGELLTFLDEFDAKFSWQEIGPVTHAGWNGISFGLSFEGSAAGQQPLLTISDDQRLRPLARPFVELQSGRFPAFGRLLTLMPPGSKPILERGAPLRLMALELVDTGFAPIDPSRFALPANPMSLDEIRASSALVPRAENGDGQSE